MNSSSLRVGILGTGAVGGYLAAVLQRGGCDVICVAREATCAVIEQTGLEIESRLSGLMTVRVKAVSRLLEPVDVLFIATKFPGLDDGVQRVASSCSAVIPLLNGLEHMVVLQQKFPDSILGAGSIYIESVCDGAGKIRQLSTFCRLEVSKVLPGDTLQSLSAALESQQVTLKVLESNLHVLWSKLVPLNALACVTAAAGGDMTTVRSEARWLNALESCLSEAATVAKAQGVEISIPEILEGFGKLPGSFSSSMQRDLAAGRHSELDAIPGSLLRQAKLVGVECPTIRSLVDTIKTRYGEEESTGALQTSSSGGK